MLMDVLEGDASIGALLGLFQANFSQAGWFALKIDVFFDVFDLEHRTPSRLLFFEIGLNGPSIRKCHIFKVSRGKGEAVPLLDGFSDLLGGLLFS